MIARKCGIVYDRNRNMCTLLSSLGCTTDEPLISTSPFSKNMQSRDRSVCIEPTSVPSSWRCTLQQFHAIVKYVFLSFEARWPAFVSFWLFSMLRMMPFFRNGLGNEEDIWRADHTLTYLKTGSLFCECSFIRDWLWMCWLSSKTHLHAVTQKWAHQLFLPSNFRSRCPSLTTSRKSPSR